MSRLPHLNRTWVSHLRLGGLMLASIWIGFRVGGLAGSSADPLDLSAYGISGVLARLLVLVATPIIVLAIHEAGHLVVGLGEGFRFSFYGVGPLWAARVADRVRWAWNRFPATWGGATILVPATFDRLVRRMAFTIVAGPLASLLFALLAVGLFAQLRGDTSAAAELLSFFLVIGGASSAGVFVATLFPASSGVGFHTDGARLFRLVRGGAGAAREAALLTLYNLSASGVRPRDWQPALVDDAAALDDVSLESATGAWWAHLYAVDAGELERAEEMYERARTLGDQVGASFRRAIAADAAHYEATVRGRLAEARHWLGEAQGPFVSPLRRTIAAAAVAIGERRGEDAARLIAEAERLLARSGLGISDADAEDVERLADALRGASV